MFKNNTHFIKKSFLLPLVGALFLNGCASSSPTRFLKSSTYPITASQGLVIQLASPRSTVCPVLSVCFTPGQACTQQINNQILSAHDSILVQAYNFSSKPIADALIAANNQGVSVKVILDKSQLTQRSSLLHYIVNAGIPVWIDSKLAIAHNKIMILDEKKVITGSFNFTDAAQKRNAENVVFITDNTLAYEYTKNWEIRKSKSYPYQ